MCIPRFFVAYERYLEYYFSEQVTGRASLPLSSYTSPVPLRFPLYFFAFFFYFIYARVCVCLPHFSFLFSFLSLSLSLYLFRFFLNILFHLTTPRVCLSFLGSRHKRSSYDVLYALSIKLNVPCLLLSFFIPSSLSLFLYFSH